MLKLVDLTEQFIMVPNFKAWRLN